MQKNLNFNKYNSDESDVLKCESIWNANISFLETSLRINEFVTNFRGLYDQNANEW